MIIKETKSIFKIAINKILASKGTDDILSEAALPAYAHKNPIIDFIFWKRIDIAFNEVISDKIINKNILDFGCGTGVLSYHLSKSGYSMTAIDLDMSPKNQLSEYITYPDNINFIEGDILKLNFDKKFDSIIALDVLEHIPLEVLPVFLKRFDDLLSPNGKIIISGPTENVLYKIGRFLAGSDFTGSYHETNIDLIKKEFLKVYKVRVVKKLYFPFTLFEIFSATKR
jgi:2-polyprenyl-3-methyl-5-hydroxy-6-metoxy-1,4-benzoquinol methylase